MRDPARIDKIIERLRALWYMNPDSRLGQLVFNVAARARPGKDIFFIEDDVMLDGIEDVIELIGTDPDHYG